MALISGGIVAAMLAGLAALLGTLIARIMIGGGFALIIYQGIDLAVQTFSMEFDSLITGLPADVLAILARAGFGEAITVMVSTVIGVASVALAANAVRGVRKT